MTATKPPWRASCCILSTSQPNFNARDRERRDVPRLFSHQATSPSAADLTEHPRMHLSRPQNLIPALACARLTADNMLAGCCLEEMTERSRAAAAVAGRR
ncbi:hypothetical protein HBH70_146440 [Parastagonospora nodorum]|nr:hypothetical protein HBH53_115330 [Parastagonospora nodorum]KAH4064227.1 hypothetical protein HBH50_176420 [Parastagonospora nodorum]KAH4079367.1 hypothetical protein HBH46_234240 [Parastagonospora nodorum]KAH4084351.1 hypothetical protein HBH48_168070 [Parastagonospora nodorum]KAH4112878.1 hypothetical protein HBH47_217870 [Parastagonospora nodorum]